MRAHILAATVIAVFLSAPARAEIRVVASIVPVHSLVSAVMQGIGEPHLLVPGIASPHSFAMRPSDARRLEDAQAVFWIGPMLESFLDRPLKALARDADVVALIDAAGVELLPIRERGPWEAHAHGGDAEKHGGVYRRAADSHIWLDPRNAAAMARAIAHALGRIDPANKARYGKNADRVAARIGALDGKLAKALSPVKGKPYIVFHDAYQYFEARYGLAPVGSVTVNPEIGPGAKRMVEMRARITRDDAICVFSEPQFEPRIVATLVQGTRARTAALDPEGATVEPGPGAYFALMRKLADDLAGCLLGRR